MRNILTAMVLSAILAPCLFTQWGCSSRNAANAPTVGQGRDISVAYLEQGRIFRDQGRYDLARQSFAQALSTCRNNANLDVIRREMDACELLIRTMR